MPLGYVSPGCAAPTYVAVAPSAATCPQAPTVGPAIYARGALFTNYYAKNGVTCSGPNTNAGFVLYGISGAEIPPTSFQVATSAIE
jgi:hypothetical protein